MDDGNSPFELRRDQRRDQKLGIQARKKSSAEWKDTIEVDEPIPVGQRYSGEPVYIVSKAVSPPQVTKAPDPEYPEYERQQKREGTTVLRIVVGELGYVDNIAAEREGFPGFVPSAVRAVTKWAFRPAKLKTNGTPVACLINVEVNFRLY